MLQSKKPSLLYRYLSSPLVSILAFSVIMLAGVASLPETTSLSPRQSYSYNFITPADTDSVLISPLFIGSDSTLSDSTSADSTSTDSTDLAPLTPLADYYLGTRRPANQFSVSLFPRRRRAMMPKIGRYWDHTVKLDTTELVYNITESVGDLDVRIPTILDLEAYKQATFNDAVSDTWITLAEQNAKREKNKRRGGFGVDFVVPGGRESAFTSIFGKPGISLRVNGRATINAGFAYQNSEQRNTLSGQNSRTDPDFEQQINLNITGTIGDKLKIDVNWDTERDFDFQNQLKLVYTGYEDEIIQRIEAGNVFLNTPATLINGGQRLFGIKTELQFGGIHLTSIASQQEGQSSELSLTGGSQTTEYSVNPVDYDNNIHFFTGFYFRNQWEVAHSQPPNILHTIERITDVQIWKLNPNGSISDEDISVVAVTDLAEPASVRDSPISSEFPDPNIDDYSEADLTNMRDGDFVLQDLFESKGLDPSDYTVGPFKQLIQGRDFDFDPYLGFVSLTSRLQDNEALAIVYRYQTLDGRIIEVGDFPSGGGDDGTLNGQRRVMKLLRGTNEDPTSAGWWLTMRNIYKLPGRGLEPTEFELAVHYEKAGQTPRETLPGVTIGSQQPLLQALGLDRLNESASATPDNQFDFIQGYTIDANNGRVIFPYLEPFGSRIQAILESNATSFSGTTQEEAIQDFVFARLYTEKQRTAQLASEFDIYRINGSYTGSVKEVYSLGFLIVENSVRVTSGDVELREGSDYIVDYASGTLTITNRLYLSPGRDLKVSYENNQFSVLQKKTLLGLRADYSAFGERLRLGSTLMRLSERPVVDKFRLGEEPITNTIWGVDGEFKIEPRWLTRAVDFLPLIQTKEPSLISFKGEFAQLRPGHANTTAYDNAVDRLDKLGRRFSSDEQSGISFIDSFEGGENTYPLNQPTKWKIAAPPLLAEDDDPVLRTNLRAGFTWYVLPNNRDELANIGVNDDNLATRSVAIQEVFDRATGSQQSQTLTLFDVYFDPNLRGPYNYSTDYLTAPADNWGGMIHRLPDSYSDFNDRNFEFIEFYFSPVPNPNGTIDENAFVYIDLGAISEDILPNGEMNTEDGLALDGSGDIRDGTRRPAATQDNLINTQGQRTEDLGLDGLASSDQYVAYANTEQTEHVAFLEALQAADLVAYNRAFKDPSGDDFHYYLDETYFGDTELFPAGVPTQQRFMNFYPSHELNTIEAQREVAGTSGFGLSTLPDAEDLNRNASLDFENRFLRYRLPLSQDVLENMLQNPVQGQANVVVDAKLDGKNKWYLIRIPLSSYENQFGFGTEAVDFRSMKSIRIWASGLTDPVTMRFAELGFVGSQWRKSEPQIDDTSPDGTITISSVNTEENSQKYRSPTGTIISSTRQSNGELVASKEQALTLRLQDILPGDERSIFRIQSPTLDLLRYRSLRMFTHAHGTEINGGFDAGAEDVRAFIRIGTDELNDYYEYEIELASSDPNATDLNADDLWQVYQESGLSNEIVIDLGTLNQLKISRDNANARTDSVYWNTDVNRTSEPKVLIEQENARIGIKGNPTLSNIKTIILGVKNTETNTTNFQDVTVWFNEMRVAGYDESVSWAAIGNANVKFADLGSIQSSIRRQTAGFGSLESALGTRDQNNTLSWSVNSNLNLDKFIPARFGWRIPVSYSIRTNTSTPEFSPNRGDIRIDDILTQIDNDPDLDEIARGQQKDAVIENAQTFTETQSFSVPISKSGSESPFLKYTLDALSLRYSYTQSNKRSPSVRRGYNWSWNSGLNYQLNIPKAKAVRPFSFLDEVPVLGILGKLPLNLLPQSITASASASRQFSETQQRPRATLDTSSVSVPDIIQNPLRQSHALDHSRKFSIRYNPFPFLGLSYGNDTKQNFRLAGVDSVYNVIGEDGQLRYSGFDRIFAENILAESQVSADAWLYNTLDPTPESEVLSRIFQSSTNVRTDSYNENFSATLTLKWDKVNALNWMELRPISLRSNYRWANGPVVADPSQERGAAVQNSFNIGTDFTILPQKFWRKFEFYRNLEKTQRDYERQVERDRRAAEKDTTDKPFEFPEISLKRGLRRLALALTGIDRVSIGYSTSTKASSSNVPGGYSIYDLFRGDGPSLRYRLGIDNSINVFDRLQFNEGKSFQVVDNFNSANKLTARTSLKPSKKLTISLTWSAGWSENQASTLRFGTESDIIRTTAISGNRDATIWAFGASYESLRDSQRALYQADSAAAGGASTFGDANNDGLIALTNKSNLVTFRDAFLGGSKTIDDRGFLPFPLPNWNVSYTGIKTWPFFRSFTKSAKLSHNYAATYGSSFKSNAAAGIGEDGNPITKSFSLLGSTLEYPLQGLEGGPVRVNENFNPLIGFEATWNGGLTTNLKWNKTNTYNLNPALSTVSLMNTSQIQLQVRFSKRGLKLPFFKKKLENTILFTLSGSYASNSEQRYRLKSDLEGQAQDIPIGLQRITLAPQLNYKLSSRVSADFFVEYERTISEDSRQPSRTNVKGGFKFNINISN